MEDDIDANPLVALDPVANGLDDFGAAEQGDPPRAGCLPRPRRGWRAGRPRREPSSASCGFGLGANADHCDSAASFANRS